MLDWKSIEGGMSVWESCVTTSEQNARKAGNWAHEKMRDSEWLKKQQRLESASQAAGGELDAVDWLCSLQNPMPFTTNCPISATLSVSELCRWLKAQEVLYLQSGKIRKKR